MYVARYSHATTTPLPRGYITVLETTSEILGMYRVSPISSRGGRGCILKGLAQGRQPHPASIRGHPSDKESEETGAFDPTTVLDNDVTQAADWW